MTIFGGVKDFFGGGGNEQCCLFRGGSCLCYNEYHKMIVAKTVFVRFLGSGQSTIFFWGGGQLPLDPRGYMRA